MKAVLVDDEKPARETLELMLEQYCPDVELMASLQSAREAIDYLEEHKPDILFLDIRMPDKDGFDVLEESRLDGVNVIFTTAFDQYALKAFTVSACHYLLKPISPKYLIEAVSRARENREGGKTLQFLRELMKTRKEGFPDKMLFPVKKGYEVVHVEDIVHLEGERNYSYVHTRNGNRFLVARTLKELEEALNPAQFCRVHHSHIVNISDIRRILSGNNYSLIIRDDLEIPVSRSRKNTLLDLLKSRW